MEKPFTETANLTISIGWEGDEFISKLIEKGNPTEIGMGLLVAMQFNPDFVLIVTAALGIYNSPEFQKILSQPEPG
jgi:hypothetical protein